MFKTIIPMKSGFATNPIELGPEPTIEAKWADGALPVIKDLLAEVKAALA